MTFWIIRNVNEPKDFWSNEYGWVDNLTYDVFLTEDKETLSLPIEGEWVCLDWLA